LDQFNVLFITADQWRGECLSVLGHPCVRTPNLDRLTREGVLFERHYCQAAPCAPSRTSIHSGMYLQNHRVARNGTPFDYRHTNMALEVRKAGYAPILFGYTDTPADPRVLPAGHPDLSTYEGILPGYDVGENPRIVPRPHIEYLRARGYDLPLEEWATHTPDRGAPGAAGRAPTFAPLPFSFVETEAAFLVDAVLDRVIERGGRPFFAHLSTLRPHFPYVAPEPFNRLIDPDDVPPPRRRDSAALEAEQHPLLRFAIEFIPAAPFFHGAEGLVSALGERTLRQLRATYYGMIAEVDYQLGRLFDGLRRAGLYERTLIIFTTDHGDQLGDHYLLDKGGYFDESYRIPLIIRLPGEAGRAMRGRRVGAFTENVDLMPTVLDWLGLPIPVQCDGRSLLPFLRGEMPASWRTEAHYEFDFREVRSGITEKLLGLALDECTLNVIRDERYKYVHFTALPPLFFDLAADPDEFVNRAEDPAYQGLVLRYAQKMLSWRMVNDERLMTGIDLGDGGPYERPRAERFRA
jgi:arylsulfatase A-like enzyme